IPTMRDRMLAGSDAITQDRGVWIDNLLGGLNSVTEHASELTMIDGPIILEHNPQISRALKYGGGQWIKQGIAQTDSVEYRLVVNGYCRTCPLCAIRRQHFRLDLGAHLRLGFGPGLGIGFG